MMRPCLSCGEPGKGTRCASCQSERNIARGSSTRRGYTSKWRRLSERYRRLTPFCELHYDGCTRTAVDVDHRLPLRAGGRSTWANACAVCRPCHAIKTREDAVRYPAHA